ncbi:MAG: hypothetical protein H0U49_01915 [Parachlamydiaceae bacterium]|nr:hypothetical protein [Parachlamydiaceae bacterium]
MDSIKNLRTAIIPMVESPFCDRHDAYAVHIQHMDIPLLKNYESTICMDLTSLAKDRRSVPSTWGHEWLHELAAHMRRKAFGTIDAVPLPYINQEQETKLIDSWLNAQEKFCENKKIIGRLTGAEIGAGNLIFGQPAKHAYEYSKWQNVVKDFQTSINDYVKLKVAIPEDLTKKLEAALEMLETEKSAWHNEIPSYLWNGKMEFSREAFESAAGKELPAILDEIYGAKIFTESPEEIAKSLAKNCSKFKSACTKLLKGAAKCAKPIAMLHEIYQGIEKEGSVPNGLIRAAANWGIGAYTWPVEVFGMTATDEESLKWLEAELNKRVEQSSGLKKFGYQILQANGYLSDGVQRGIRGAGDCAELLRHAIVDAVVEIVKVKGLEAPELFSLYMFGDCETPGPYKFNGIDNREKLLQEAISFATEPSFSLSAKKETAIKAFLNAPREAFLNSPAKKNNTFTLDDIKQVNGGKEVHPNAIPLILASEIPLEEGCKQAFVKELKGHLLNNPDVLCQSNWAEIADVIRLLKDDLTPEESKAIFQAIERSLPSDEKINELVQVAEKITGQNKTPQQIEQEREERQKEIAKSITVCFNLVNSAALSILAYMQVREKIPWRDRHTMNIANDLTFIWTDWDLIFHYRHLTILIYLTFENY